MASRSPSLIWAIFTVALAYGQKTPRTVSVEQLLFKEIFSNYDMRVRPAFDSNQVINVSLSMGLHTIFEVDERNQVLTTQVWLRQKWLDPRLAWNPAEHGSFTTLRIPCQQIWLPDLVLYNSVEDQSRRYHKSLAIVKSDGTVYWPPMMRFMSSCQMDITLFPFDDQICFFKLGSWAYDKSQMDVFWQRSGLELTTYVNNSEWSIMDTHVVKNVVYYPCCKEPYPDITFYIHIRRRHFYYIFNMIFPCLLLSLLPIFSFALPPDSDEKVTLGLTILVACSVIMLLIAGIMPPTSEYTPLISIYLIVFMGLTSCTVMLSILVLNLHHRGIINRRPPPLLYHLIVRHLGRMVCVSQKRAEMFIRGFGSDFPTSRRSQKVGARTLVEASAGGNLDANEEGDTMDVGTAGEESVEMISTASKCSTGNKDACKSSNNNNNNNNNNKNSNTNESSVRSSSNEAANETQTIILSHLQQMSSKQHRIDEEAACTREWQLMAYVLDRLLLVCFITLLVLLTAYLLLFKPMFKRASIIKHSGS